MKKIDMNTWPRKSHFEFFKTYDNPFFNICTEMDITEYYKRTKALQQSFFISSLYLSLQAANEIEEFRQRIRGDEVIVHDTIHSGSTILNDDDTFGFCYFEFNPDYHEFRDNASATLKRYKENGNSLDPQDFRDDLIHYSIIPWISFTSVSHPRKYRQEDSIPKIVFGKYHQTGDRLLMPISVEVHHSLMDGIHVGRYLKRFQNMLDNFEPPVDQV